MAVDLEAHGDNPYEAIYHEYYHSVTVPYFSGLPLWLKEGMADFYGNTEINDKNANIGMANLALIAELRDRPLLPVSALFAVNYDSPYYNEQNKVSIFYAESWALAHYLMIGDQLAHRAQFNTFLTALDKGETQQQAALEAFGDLGKIQRDLERYVHGMVFTSLLVPAPQRMDPKDLHTRVISDAESDAYRGGFLTLHRQYKDAQALLDEAVRLDPKLALAQANLGVLRYAQQQPNDALASLSAAIAIDPDNAYTRYWRANLNYSTNPATHLSDIDEDLRHAIASNANFAPPYGLLALRLTANDRDLPQALELAQKAASLEPGRPNYQYVLAQVLIRMRRYDQAEATAQHMLLQSADPALQQQAHDLLNAVQQGREFDSRLVQREQEIAAAARSSTASTAGTPVPASGAQDSSVVTTESTPTPVAPVATDNRIRGMATQVICNGNAMRVTVKTDDNTLVLHVADARKIDYTSYVLIRAGSISPCDDIKGHSVRVTTKDGTPNSDITALDIMK